MRRCLPALGLWILMLVCQRMSAKGDVTVAIVDYNGWHGAYQMSNGTVELVFVPQIGRVMRYGFVGGPNVLWNNPALAGKTTDLAHPPADWQNYGGDKLWPAPQSAWKWPPDPILDSGDQTVTVLPMPVPSKQNADPSKQGSEPRKPANVPPNQHLHIEGHTSYSYHIRFIRDITMAPTGTEVTFKNTMINANSGKAVAPDVPGNVSWSIWEVAQLDDPSEARLLLNKRGKFPSGYYAFPDNVPVPEALTLTPTLIRIRRDSHKQGKIGGDSPQGYLEAVVHDVAFRISARIEGGKPYPDNGCSQEIFTNPELTYAELELLSPVYTLAPEKSAEFTTHWSLTRTTP